MSEPIPMLLFCPMCNTRHVDEGEFATKVHHTHACQNAKCGMVWRPAIEPTVGVWFLPGFNNALNAIAEASKRTGSAVLDAWEETQRIAAETRKNTAEISLSAVLEQVAVERRLQDRQWGGADHDDEHSASDWLNFIDEHRARARKAATSRTGGSDKEHRKQLVEIAALAVAAIQAHDRRSS